MAGSGARVRSFVSAVGCGGGAWVAAGSSAVAIGTGGGGADAVRTRSTSVKITATETPAIAATTADVTQTFRDGLSAMSMAPVPVAPECNPLELGLPIGLALIPLTLAGSVASPMIRRFAAGIVPLEVRGNSDTFDIWARISRCSSARTSRKASLTMRPISSCRIGGRQSARYCSSASRISSAVW